MTRIILCLILCAGWAVADDKAAKIEAVLDAYTKHEVFNGSALVAYKGEVVYKGGHGFADMEWRVPNTADTRHRIGSVTKQFTAVLILKLVDQGKISLDDTVSKILPDYPKETGEKITVHHLLRHTSGIPNYTNPTFFRTKSMIAKTPTEFLDYFQDKPLDFEPGSAYAYSNSGYFLLGVLIEKITGQTYEAFLHEQILDPLGLKDTGYDNSETILARRARGYEWGPLGLQNAKFLHMSLPYSAGSMYATVEDLYTWDRALANGKVLPPELMKKMFTPGKDNYGYGWQIMERPFPGAKEPGTLITHGGGINGFNALFTRYPSEGFAIALLNNTGGTILDEIQRKIVQILAGMDVKPPKAPAAMALRRQFGTKPVSQICKELLADRDNYEFSEVLLNNMGYYLLGQKKMDDALAVFKLNVAVYPKAFNTYDSLAECQAAMGDKKEAVANYQRSLELNPENTNAVEQIKKLKN